MSSARFPIVVLLFSLPALAQNTSLTPRDANNAARAWWQADVLNGTSALPASQQSLLAPKTTSPAPEQLTKGHQASTPTTEEAKRIEETNNYLVSQDLDPNTEQLTTSVSPQGTLTSDAADVCYSIRSYLMARDSKDSDSTHPVKTSTCQPARHYRLKTADSQPHVLVP